MVGFTAFRYRISLKEPLWLGGRKHAIREGLVVRSQQSQDAWGDAAPLAGFSKESLDDVISALSSPTVEWPASLQFAVDSALPSLEANTPNRIPVNALLIGDADAVLRQAEVVCRAGYRSAKLKVGRNSNIREDARLVRQVRRILREDQMLRLDANRAWDLETAIEFARTLGDVSVEYIEEPTRESCDLDRFFDATQMPYALDESLLEGEDLAACSQAAALIVKPTLLGGRSRIQSLAATGLPLVFSSCFESGVGVLNIARWAAAYAPETPAGLDTYRWIGGDILRNRLEMSDGYLRIDVPLDVDVSCLEEICR